MKSEPLFKQHLVGAVPALRAFALTLCRTGHLADDLVQETLLRAWEHQDQFSPGTNFKAWIFTILRNHYYSHYRKAKREVLTDEAIICGALHQPPEQLRCLEFLAFKDALMKLPAGHREALLLVGASGFTIQEAANICGVAEGTIKSRVNRARNALSEFAADEVSFAPLINSQTAPTFIGVSTI